MAVDAHPGTPRLRRHRWWPWLVAAVIVAGGAVAYLALRHRSTGADMVAPVTMTVKHAPFNVTVTGPGSLSPIRSVSLSPSVSGRLVAMASVGDRVEQGASLAQLDPAPFQRAVADARLSLEKAETSLAVLEASQAKAAATLASQIASARSDLDAAQRSFDSQKQSVDLTQTLFGMGSASANELQSAKDALSTAQETLTNAHTSLDTLLETQKLQQTADQKDLANARVAVEQAQLSLTSALQDLQDAEVVAPFAGVVSAANAAVGEPAGASGALLTLVDDSKVVLEAQIDETDIGRVAVGQAAAVTLDAASERTYPARVARIAPTATLVSNIPIFYVLVEIDNADHALRAGMTGQATVVVQEIPAAFQVPARAVHSAGGSSSILVRAADGGFRQVPVTVVGTSGINSVLTGNVPEGAVVLVSGEGSTAPAQGSEPGNQRNDRRPSAVPFANPGGGFRNPRRLSGTTGRQP